MAEPTTSTTAPFEGLSDEDRQKALDIGASMQFESVTTDHGLKTPTITPTIGDQLPVYGETYVVTPEQAPEPADAAPKPTPSE